MSFAFGHPVKNIAIVGAGPAGIAAAKYLLAEAYYDKIDVYEEQDSFGGVWLYEPAANIDDRWPVPQTNAHTPLEQPQWLIRKGDEGSGLEPRPCFSTPMYEGLETNIPGHLMEHAHFTALTKEQLFPSRASVLKYLQDYAEDVRPQVRFCTQVRDIRLESKGADDTWTLESLNLLSGQRHTERYDAVVVASGHYSVPFTPSIKGIAEWNSNNPGVVLHSKFYDHPAQCQGKKTVVVGFGASGIDIANHISTAAKKPILVSTRAPLPFAGAIPYIEEVPEIAEFLPPSKGERAIRFVDGRIETEVDMVLCCTGYLYSFPYLSTLQPPVISAGARVEHVYEHIFYSYHPTLAFIGLPFRIIPFRTFESQAAIVAKVWANRLTLPSAEDMEKHYEKDIETQGSGRTFHKLEYPEDFDYHNSLVAWASRTSSPGVGTVPPKWSEEEYWVRKRLPDIKRAFMAQGESRQGVKTMEQLGFEYVPDS